MSGVLAVIDASKQIKIGAGFELPVEAGGTGRVDGLARGTAVLANSMGVITQYAPVVFDVRSTSSGATLIVEPVDAITDQILGIALLGSAGDTGPIPIMTEGICLALVNGAVVNGDYLYPTAAGRLSATVTIALPVARALSNNTAGDGQVWAYIDPKLMVQALTTQVITLPFIIDQGGLTIAPGIKGKIGPFDFACTIEQWSLLADQTGSIVVDIWKDTYANYPPTVADTITAAAKPTITTAVKNQSAVLTGWTTGITIGDILLYNVDSVTTIQQVTLALKLRRT